MQKRFRFILVAAAIILSGILALSPQNVSASAESTLLDKQILAAFSACIKMGDIYGADKHQSLDELRGGDFFGSQTEGYAAVGYAVEARVGGEAKDGKISCSEKDNALAKLFFSHFGMSITDEFITNSGVFKPSGNGYFALDTDNGPAAALNWVISNATKNKVTTLTLTDEEQYHLFRQFLDNPGCRAGGQTSQQVWVVANNGVPSQTTMYFRSGSSIFPLGNPNSMGSDSIYSPAFAMGGLTTCQAVADWLSNAANIAPRISLRLQAIQGDVATTNVQLPRTGTPAATLVAQSSWGPSGPWSNVTGVTSSVSYTSGGSGWLTVNITGSSISVSANQNSNAQQRSAKITLNYTDTTFNKPASKDILITQPGTATLEAKLEPENYLFEAGGGSRTYTFQVRESGAAAFQDTVPTNAVINDANGISITSRDGAKIEVEVAANPDTDERSLGSLVITYGGQQYTFLLTQEGMITPPGDGTAGGQSECQLGKMGWMLCPLIEGMDAMLGGLYGIIENNFLQINVEFYNMDEDGTYGAWQVFRNIANIVFVILFLIIIFSQVTSVGISNYGIKKMLPEIIMAAILINLSYFICQAMVDFSNIVGSQIKLLLESVITVPGANLSAAAETGSWIGTIVAVLGITVAGFALATVLMGGIGAVLAGILLLLISGLIGTLVIFLLLIARQVGVIVFIVIAPLAFAARILPNTQNLFKKWWSAFVSLLVVYPACGLVLGAGTLAGRVMARAANNASTAKIIEMSGDVFPASITSFAAVAMGVVFAIAAGIAMIAPYFAVIPIIKGSLNGLGKLGGAITGKVTGAGKWGQNNINKAPGIRNLQRITDAGRAARAGSLKAKAEAANAVAASKSNSAVSKMNRAQIESKQAQDAAALASVGQYVDDGSGSRQNARLMAISAKRAAEIGVDPTTGLPTRVPKDDVERELQAAAKTARNQTDAKAAKQAAEGFEGRPAADVYGEVYDEGGKTFTAATSQIEAEQAIKHMESKGEWKKSAAMQDAYMAKWGGTDSRGRGRLGQILQSKDSKEQSFARNAYGKALAEKGYSGTFEQFMKNQDENGVHTGKGISDAINSPKYRNSYGSMHGEAIAELVKHDTDGSLRKKIAQDMNLQSVGQMGDNIESFVGDGKAGTGAELFSHVAEDYVAAGSNAATLGYTSKTKQAIGVAGNSVDTGSGSASVTSPSPSEPTINFQTITDSSYTDTATGTRVEDIRAVDLSGQEVLSQITKNYTPAAGEVAGGKQYYQNAVDQLSTEQLGQIIQHDNRVNAGGKVTDQHYSQLRSFAQKSLASRGETAGARASKKK